MKLLLRVIAALGCLAAATVHAEPPKTLDDDLVLELVASEPEIVTPVGLVVDGKNRIWAIENNTHQTKPDYQGPTSDRIRVFEDLDPHGRARNVSTFADGFRNAMNLAFGPDGSLYLATRSEIRAIADPQGKRIDAPVVLKLETKGDYPHNGLGGMTFDREGNLYVGMGENLGAAYRLVGSDGASLSGQGEGGNVFACRADGSKLHRVATGFWNPFQLAFGAGGALFAVDNDPDARGPCRLLHVIEGGDYGYRFRYGRKGLHPFDSWNGELPGTLPMVSGTGEAPSGIVAYNGAGLPAKYRGSLLTTSWGDHVIECFHLVPRGASFQATAQTVVRGGEDFRPVALAIGPDGAIYFTDWVDRSYPVHGKGRIWRLRGKQHRTTTQKAKDSPTAAPGDEEPARSRLLEVQALKQAPLQAALEAVSPLLADADPFLRSAAIDCLARPGATKYLAPLLESDNPRSGTRESSVGGAAGPRNRRRISYITPQWRVGALLALRRSDEAEARKLLPRLLDDASPAVRRAAIQWTAEENVSQYAEQLPAAAAKAPTSPELFRALLAAQHLLGGGKPGAEPYDEQRLFATLADGKQPAVFRRLALQLLRPDYPELKTALLHSLLDGDDAELQLEAVRTLALRHDEASRSMLRAVAGDERASAALRAEALLGLAAAELKPEDLALLFSALDEPPLRRDALRGLRAAKSQPEVVERLRQWRSRLSAADKQDGELASQLLFFFDNQAIADPAGERTELRRAAPVRPEDERAWRSQLAGGGDAQAGRRVFFHPQGPRCYVCHQIEGRGGAIGPELTTIGRSRPQEHLIASILQPSREIAPRYVAWTIVTADGRQLTGMIVDEDFSGRVTLADGEGRLTVVPQQTIDEREPQRNSIMPDKLYERMTLQEFRDLLAFLTRSGSTVAGE
ncbi:MAG TPA: PVC-type heme-binding CxxCH protein [Pirellulales bacterium]|nr:PVC-type heme-binding CxxCH protein [Pirellulales bacterium]